MAGSLCRSGEKRELDALRSPDLSMLRGSVYLHAGDVLLGTEGKGMAPEAHSIVVWQLREHSLGLHTLRHLSTKAGAATVEENVAEILGIHGRRHPLVTRG